MRDELPHSIAVVVEEMGLRAGPSRGPAAARRARQPLRRALARRRASSSATKGARLREVGTTARKNIEAMLGTPVYLDLRVKIAKDWQRDPRQLRRLGF